MALRIANPPPGGMDAVNEALALLAQARPEKIASSAGSGSLVGRQLIAPQKVYQIPLDKLGRKEPLKFAEPVAWRYLIVEGDDEGPVEAAETTLGGAEPIRFSGVNRGPQVAGFMDAIHYAETIAKEQSNMQWELRYLRIPALYVDAVWLYDVQEGRSADLFIPIPPVFPPLETHHNYGTNGFFSLLSERAAQRLEQSNDRNG